VEINKEEYKLSKNNYFKKEFPKHSIVLGNSFSMNMKHYYGWVFRNNGEHKKTAPYTIDIHGEIFEHYDSKYYSNFIDVEMVDKHIIPIFIENEGYLTQYGKKYKDFIGREYFRDDEVVVRKWRNHTHWAPYSKEQVNSAVWLVNHLKTKFNIGGEVISDNTKHDNIYNMSGVMYRSNYNSYYTDISPSWDSIKFKEKLEI